MIPVLTQIQASWAELSAAYINTPRADYDHAGFVQFLFMDSALTVEGPSKGINSY